MIGVILGSRYELLEKIGEGGMAEVYKARCNKLNRFVAVKILKKEFCDNEDIVDKFKREATAIATLSDNNIVNVLDVGTQDNINYIVMEYVKGKTLKEFIKQFGKLNYESAITIGMQIAKALECAHKNNIIHRDVKPQNILVTEEGIIKVTDFGIAKSASSATLTNTTTIMGSAHYFSPEQAKGSVVDNRADIYSLGIVLYEMVTGKLPFEADSPVTIALKHIQEEVVAPKTINSKIPDNLNKLIVKCMEKDPAMRYQNAREVITDLQKIKDDPNAIIAEDLSSDNEGHTIVMAPVNPVEKDVKKNQAVKDLEDEYYDDEDDYDEDDEDDDYEYRKRKKGKGVNKKLIIGIVSVVALVLLGVGAFFMFSGGGSSTSGKVEVPNIKGMTVEKAKEALKASGLEYLEADTQVSDEPGLILDVDPSEGTSVDKGSTVRVTVSVKEEGTEVPDLRESERNSAETILKSKGFNKYDFVQKNDENIPKGQVISTDPVAKTKVSKDTTITVYISDGPKIEMEIVPNVKGYTLEEAKKKLGKFKVAVTFKDVTDKNDDNKVLDQTNLDKRLEVQSTVTLTVGKYKEPEEQPTKIDPSIKGMKGSAAKAKLLEQGFKNIEFAGDGSDDIVISYTPESAKKGDKIVLTTKKETESPVPTPPAN